MFERKPGIPCKATFRIQVVLQAPINVQGGAYETETWVPIGTFNDTFMADLLSDNTDDRALSHEVAKMVKEFKDKWQNVVTLENILAQPTTSPQQEQAKALTRKTLPSSQSNAQPVTKNS